MGALKQQFDLPFGYTPLQGPTDEQKKRFLLIIGLINKIIVVVVIVVELL